LRKKEVENELNKLVKERKWYDMWWVHDETSKWM
jgi:hypothetical protein